MTPGTALAPPPDGKIAIDLEFQALVPPLQVEEQSQLEANLKRDGCREPLVLWKEGGVLLDGHNRLDICRREGLEFSTVALSLADRDEARLWVVRNQFGRRNLSPYQRAELALVAKPLLAAQAKTRQGTRTDFPKISAECFTAPKATRETRTQLATLAGVSHDTIQKAEVLSERATTETKEKLRRGNTTINAEYKKVIQAERKAEQIKAVQSATLPTGTYHVIVIDPPWAYQKRAQDVTHRGRAQYPLMTPDEIARYPLGQHARADCVLWLWTTNAFMEEAHQVARAWGFQVKTILTWAKHRMGTGDWLRGQTEHCLMAVKGGPVVDLTNQTTLLHAPMREHSRKPDEFYDLVRALCPGTRCEFFGRENRDGFDTFGAEAGRF